MDRIKKIPPLKRNANRDTPGCATVNSESMDAEAGSLMTLVLYSPDSECTDSGYSLDSHFWSYVRKSWGASEMQFS